MLFLVKNKHYFTNGYRTNLCTFNSLKCLFLKRSDLSLSYYRSEPSFARASLTLAACRGGLWGNHQAFPHCENWDPDVLTLVFHPEPGSSSGCSVTGTADESGRWNGMDFTFGAYVRTLHKQTLRRDPSPEQKADWKISATASNYKRATENCYNLLPGELFLYQKKIEYKTTWFCSQLHQN